MTSAARAVTERKTFGHRSYRVTTRRQPHHRPSKDALIATAASDCRASCTGDRLQAHRATVHGSRLGPELRFLRWTEQALQYARQSLCGTLLKNPTKRPFRCLSPVDHGVGRAQCRRIRRESCVMGVGLFSRPFRVGWSRKSELSRKVAGTILRTWKSSRTALQRSV